MSMLKARLREAMEIKKISQKALDIINERLDYYCIKRTNNLYEEILWPKNGEFKVDYLRINGDLQIYDIAYQELVNLSLEVLTEKARVYLEFIEEKSI